MPFMVTLVPFRVVANGGEFEAAVAARALP